MPFAGVDESCFFFQDGANPDHEIIASLRPSAILKKKEAMKLLGCCGPFE
jgi:hypothetical protein